MDTINPILNDQLAPEFTLTDLKGIPHSLTDLNNRIVIINFWSAECPVSQRCDFELLSLLERCGEQVVLLTIAANANEPPEMLAKVSAERGLPNVLLDADQAIADLYGAQTTPHLFVLDTDGILRYQGAFDDITFRQREATVHYLQDAVEALLTGSKPEIPQSPPYGCVLVRYSPE
jgi:peroxiredoxin